MMTPNNNETQSEEAKTDLGDERPVDPTAEIDTALGLAAARRHFLDVPPEPVVFHDWLIERKLGHGGMGVVYLGRHRTIGRRVALKILTDNAANRDLVREARALAASPSPNVVAVFSVDTSTPPTVIIEQEFVDGYTLRAWQNLAAPGWRDIAATYLCVARGLAAIHAAGLVHRDIKPDNIVTSSDHNIIKIADFGLAVIPRIQAQTGTNQPDVEPSAQRTDLSIRYTVDGALVGTHGYIAPEVLAGDEASPQSDQFSFATALFEALFGELPFHGVTPELQAQAMRSNTLQLPEDEHRRIPSWLMKLLRRALSFDPTHRYETIEALMVDLDRGLGRRSRWIRGTGGMIVATALLTVGALVMWNLKPPAPDPCADVADPMRQLWSPSSRAELLDERETDSGEQEERATELFASAADRRVTAWVDARTRLCAATTRTKLLDLSAHELNLRQNACLEQTRLDVEAIVDTLTDPAKRTAASLVEGAAAIEALPTCDDRRVLAMWPPAPDDAAEVARDLARSLALEAAGDFPAAEALARSIASRPAVQPFHRAQALYRLGHSLGLQRRFLAAFEVLDQARNTAWISGYEALACSAAAFQAKLAASVALDPSASRRELGFAEACASRADANTPLLQAELLEARGLLAYAISDLDGAERWHRQALQLRRSLFADDHPDVGNSLHNLANTLASRDGTDGEAKRYFAETYAIRQRLVGPAHPTIGDVLVDEAILLSPPNAPQLLIRALAIYEKATGAHKAVRANIHVALGAHELNKGDLPRAAEHIVAARVLQKASKDLPKQHSDRTKLLQVEGALAFKQGDFPTALRLLSRVITDFRRLDPESENALDALPQWIEAAFAEQDYAAITREAQRSGQHLIALLRGSSPHEAGKLAWYIAIACERSSVHSTAVPYLELALDAYEELDEAAYVAELRQSLDSALAASTAAAAP